MRILSQDKEKILLLHNAQSVYIAIEAGSEKCKITANISGNGNEEVLGEYLTKEKAQEVLHMILECKGEQFIMP